MGALAGLVLRLETACGRRARRHRAVVLAELERLIEATPVPDRPALDSLREGIAAFTGDDIFAEAHRLGLALGRPPPAVVPVNGAGAPRPARHRGNVRQALREFRRSR